MWNNVCVKRLVAHWQHGPSNWSLVLLKWSRVDSTSQEVLGAVIDNTGSIQVTTSHESTGRIGSTNWKYTHSPLRMLIPGGRSQRICALIPPRSTPQYLDISKRKFDVAYIRFEQICRYGQIRLDHGHGMTMPSFKLEPYFFYTPAMLWPCR